MLLTIILLLLPFSSFANTDLQINYNRISLSETSHNGIQISIYLAPYMALIYADTSFPNLPFCGASIITTRHLISTAYFFHIQQNKHFKVVTGSNFAYSFQPQNYHEVRKIYIHEKYDPLEIYNDIALIELKELLELSYKVNLIKLMTFEDLYARTEEVVMMRFTSYGQQNYRIMSHLMEKSVKIHNSEVVRLDDRLLVLEKTSTNNCIGDFGSPGVVNGKLAALKIHVDSCKLTDLPTFFTGIVYYYEWIKTYVGRERLEKYPDLQ